MSLDVLGREGVLARQAGSEVLTLLSELVESASRVPRRVLFRSVASVSEMLSTLTSTFASLTSDRPRKTT